MNSQIRNSIFEILKVEIPNDEIRKTKILKNEITKKNILKDEIRYRAIFISQSLRTKFKICYYKIYIIAWHIVCCLRQNFL